MIEIDLRGAEKFLATSRRFRGALTGTIYRSLKRSMRRPVVDARREVLGSPVVDRIRRTPWGRRKENRLTARVKRFGPSIDGKTVTVGMGIYGAPAAAGTGDRIVPHDIAINQGSHAGLVIHHPGARILSQHGVGRSGLSRHESEILRQLNEDVGQLVERLYGL